MFRRRYRLLPERMPSLPFGCLITSDYCLPDHRLHLRRYHFLRLRLLL